MSAANSEKTAVGRPFQPGQSGNPSGRPKAARNFAQEVRDYLGRPYDDGDKTNLESILDDLMYNRPEILLYYAFGKPIQAQVQVTNGDDEQREWAKAVAREIVKEQNRAQSATDKTTN